MIPPTGDDEPEYWTGISRKKAATCLPGKFNMAPITGPTVDLKKFSAIYMSG